MGHRLHVAKRYSVVYALGDDFNYKVTEVHNLLDALEVSYTGESWDDQFEVLRSEWNEGIKKLQHLYMLSDEEQEEIKECVAALNRTIEEVIKSFEYFEKASDPLNDYMFFAFF